MAPHHTGIRLATLCLSILVVMKVNYIQIGHLMAKDPFILHIQLVTKHGCIYLPVKVDPGTDVNTIPLSHYKTLFPKHFTKDGHLKQIALRSTASTWSLHNGCTHNISWDTSQQMCNIRPPPI